MSKQIPLQRIKWIDLTKGGSDILNGLWSYRNSLPY